MSMTSPQAHTAHSLQYTLFLCLLLFSCREKSCHQPAVVASIHIPLRLHRLENDLVAAKTKEDIQAVFAAHPMVADRFFDVSQYPSEDALAEALFKTFQNRHLDTLYQETVNAYADFAIIEEHLVRAFQHITYYYPTFVPPTIKTVFSGLYKDVYFSDEIFIIGLDYFIGPDATYKPLDIPHYMLARYTPDYVVPTALLYLSNRYNAIDSADKSLLAAMIAAGKTFYFVAAVFPCLSQEHVIGYSRKQWEEVTANEKIIWKNFVVNRWFYEQDDLLKQRLIGERPGVPEIGSKCPGRIGAWLGWQIVRAYMAHHPDYTLPMLMEETNARKIFTLSQYKPR